MVLEGTSYPLLGFLCHLGFGFQVEGDTYGVCIATHSRGEAVVGCFIGFFVDKKLNWAIHKNRTHFTEFRTLERFSEDVSPHDVGRAVLKVDVALLVLVLD
jgi:hypothetical protein